MKKILVLGIGNLVQSDDGFGVHVIRNLLKERSWLPSNVELLDAGTSIVDQMSDMAESDRLICIDVVDGGKEPGTIFRFTPEDIVYKKSKFHHAHKISIFDTLEMIQQMKNKIPETSIISIQPERIEWGTSLSSTLKNRLADVVKIVHQEITNANND